MSEVADVPDSRVDGLGVAQRWVLVVFGALLFAVLTVPPWEAELQIDTEVRRPAGYAPIVTGADPADAFPADWDAEQIREQAGVSVDGTRLMAQAAAVLVLGGVAFVLARNWDMRRGFDDG